MGTVLARKFSRSLPPGSPLDCARSRHRTRMWADELTGSLSVNGRNRSGPSWSQSLLSPMCTSVRYPLFYLKSQASVGRGSHGRNQGDRFGDRFGPKSWFSSSWRALGVKTLRGLSCFTPRETLQLSSAGMHCAGKADLCTSFRPLGTAGSSSSPDGMSELTHS